MIKDMEKKMINDKDLFLVSGGNAAGGRNDDRTVRVSCPNCFEVFKVSADRKEVECPNCHKIITVQKK